MMKAKEYTNLLNDFSLEDLGYQSYIEPWQQKIARTKIQIVDDEDSTGFKKFDEAYHVMAIYAFSPKDVQNSEEMLESLKNLEQSEAPDALDKLTYDLVQRLHSHGNLIERSEFEYMHLLSMSKEDITQCLYDYREDEDIQILSKYALEERGLEASRDLRCVMAKLSSNAEYMFEPPEVQKLLGPGQNFPYNYLLK